MIGTFTADDVTRAFTMFSSGSNAPSPSAFQVRDITPIPGPGGAALAAIAGALGLGGRRAAAEARPTPAGPDDGS